LEVIEINRKKLSNYQSSIKYEQHDLFTWEPNRKFDVVFFSFWLSHVPPNALDDFLHKVALALAPNGRIFFY
jgi:demethylmenaquinone methyltransferase/2-methoxy-6-polyprenyl-1,4-benzoquinol methylase